MTSPSLGLGFHSSWCHLKFFTVTKSNYWPAGSPPYSLRLCQASWKEVPWDQTGDLWVDYSGYSKENMLDQNDGGGGPQIPSWSHFPLKASCFPSLHVRWLPGCPRPYFIFNVAAGTISPGRKEVTKAADRTSFLTSPRSHMPKAVLFQPRVLEGACKQEPQKYIFLEHIREETGLRVLSPFFLICWSGIVTKHFCLKD